MTERDPRARTASATGPWPASSTLTDQTFAGGGAIGERARAFDWSKTALGPVDAWPAELRAAVGIVLSSRFPMFVVWGRDLTLVYNDSYEPVLGPKHPSALGKPIREVWPEIWDTIEPMFETVLATGTPTWSEDFLFTFDRNLPREEVYFTFSYSPIRGPGGGIDGVFCACFEVTGRVVGERRLKTLRDLGRQAGTARTDADACASAASILAENPADVPFALVYLLDAEQRTARLAASTGIDASHPNAAPATIALADAGAAWPLGEALAARGPLRIERAQARVGQLPGGPWAEGSDVALVMPLTAGADHVAGFLVVGLAPRRVIDEEYIGFAQLVAGHVATALANVRAYQAERRRAEALAALDRAKTRFFDHVSHELRTPLTLLIGPLEDLRAREASEATGELVAIAHRNSLRLLKLVNALLDFARLEAGRVEARFEPTDLAQLTADLASSFRAAVERGGLRLTIDCRPVGEPVWVDLDMWEKVVLNLLSNAFKFTTQGEIEVSLQAVEGQVRLAVRDTGAGIAPDDVPHLFDRFFHRSRSGAARSVEGTGIGLALVQELVQLHGGRIDVASTPGAGSTFTVALPLGHAHLPADRVAERASDARAADGAEPFVAEALRWLAVDGEGRAPIEGEAPKHAVEPDARIVVVEDNADMRAYLCRILEGQGWEVERCADGHAGLAAIRANPPALVLSDVMLPGLDGFELLATLRKDPALRTLPVILLSGRAGEEARAEGFHATADDYIVKPFGARELVARVGAALTMARVRREHELAVRSVEERLALLQRATNDVVWDWDLRSNKITWNDEIERQTGFTRAEIGPSSEGRLSLIHEDDVDRVYESLRAALAGTAETWTDEYRVRRRDGTDAVFLDRGFIVRDERQRPKRMVGAMLDVTERERLAAEVRRAERLQAAGKLAGGMAHEVNNMMTAVLGFGDFVLKSLTDEHPVRADVQEMVKAGERAARVTQQLLAFTRRQVLQPTVVDVNQVVAELTPTLERLAGATTQIRLDLFPHATKVRVDRTQLEQVLINLVHNARDAMPRGGEVTIATREMQVDRRAGRGSRIDELEPGRHLVLTVRDTGVGMDEETLRQAFEPFFTTKPVGQGTGLGLSTVYGTVRQSGGQIALDSAVGQGTTVTIFLPTVFEAHAQPSLEARARIGGTEAVLVVEDERIVRKLVGRTLSEKGFRVTEAVDGVDALHQLELAGGKFDLVLSDIVMPRMAGRELGDAIAQRWPDLPVLFMSGYTGEEVMQRGLLAPDAHFVQKPFSPDALVQRIRDVLDRVRVAAV